MNSKEFVVDTKKAEEIFRKAVEKVKADSKNITKTQWDIEIGNIINGTHKTYRYILITALLAKATNSKINPLSLQAKAEIIGAYDARSLCHSVLVPLESELLDRSIGGSNEPFLNKPARYQTVSLSNPVRAGKDKKLLENLYTVLSEIKTSKEALESLHISIKYVLEKSSIHNKALSIISNSNDSYLKIIEFIQIFVDKSIEGQVAAITTGTVLSLYYDSHDGYKVITHPVNQSGASSKEVADIDIKKDGLIFKAFEIKDKAFSKYDAEHSAIKASKYGLKSIIFIIGKNIKYESIFLDNISKEILDKTNINVIFIDIINFTKSIIAISGNNNFGKFVETLNLCAKNTRVKEEVFEHIKKCLMIVETKHQKDQLN